MKRQGPWLLAVIVIAIAAGGFFLTQGQRRRPVPAPLPADAPTADMSSADATLEPASLQSIGAIDERYQAYNVGMVEVTGGRYWKAYAGAGEQPGDAAAAPGAEHVPAGMDPALFEARAPLDLAHPRLRALAQALAPSYLRVSGTWANTTFFADTDKPPALPPEGYGAVLTREQWLGVIAFSNAVDAPIVTSMPTGPGTRGEDAAWKPDQAKAWLAYTAANGGRIAAAEYMDAPTFASMGGAPAGYDAAAYGRDHKLFTAFLRAAHPDILILAPGSLGEADAAWAVAAGGFGEQPLLPALELAPHVADADAFSYKHFGATSQRCDFGAPSITQEDALDEAWLARTDDTLAHYRKLRDAHLPGKALWNTGTAQTACGGDPWAKTFVDTFRYLDQLGRLAKQEVRVVIHNTLAASDDALLDEKTFAPRPNYWGALLWRRLMGTIVLESGVGTREGLHVYAHCLRGQPGGVALLVINNAEDATTSLSVPTEAERYTLTADTLDADTVKLNGTTLELGAQDALPELKGAPTLPGTLRFAPKSITFLALPKAQNGACG